MNNFLKVMLGGAAVFTLGYVFGMKSTYNDVLDKYSDSLPNQEIVIEGRKHELVMRKKDEEPY